MEVSQSHWVVQAIPSMFAAQIAANNYGAPVYIDYLDVDYMLSMSLLSSPWLDDQDVASWTTLAQYTWVSCSRLQTKLATFHGESPIKPSSSRRRL